MYEYDIKYKNSTTKIEVDVPSKDSIENSNNECVETGVGNLVLHLLELDEIQKASKSDNLTEKFLEINYVLCLKKKGFTKIVVPFSLRHKLLKNIYKKFGHSGT